MFSAKTLDVLSRLAAKTATLQESGLSPEQQAASAARGLPFNGNLQDDVVGQARAGETPQQYIDRAISTPRAPNDEFSWIGRANTGAAAFAGSFDQLNRDQTAEISPLNTARDFGMSVAGGAVQGLTSLVSLPDNLLFGGALNTDEASARFSAGQQNLTSDGSNARNNTFGQLVGAEGRELDRQGVGGLERIVRDFNTTMDLTGENLSQVPQGVANAGGSFLVGGVASKGVGLGLRGAERALKSASVTRFLGRFGDDVAGALGMGAMEAGGAGIQASQAASAMSHEQLVAGSEFYNEYLARHGDTPESREAAQRAVASGAANTAMLIQAPAALLGGALTSRIAASPFRAGTVRTALANVGKEALEEAVQEGAGNFSSNVGVRTFADSNQSLTEGVGRGIAEGGLYGGLSVGAMQLPGTVARRTVERTGQAIDGLMERGRNINNANVVEERAATRDAVNAVLQPTDAVPREGVDVDLDTAELATNRPILEELNAQFTFDPVIRPAQNPTEELVYGSIDPESPSSIFDVMDTAAQLMEDVKSPQQKLDLAILINDLQGQVSSESFSKLRDLQDKVTAGGTVAAQIGRILTAQNAIATNKTLRSVLAQGIAATGDVTVEDIGDLSTPEQQRAAAKVAIQARLEPEKVPEAVAEAIRLHSAGRPSLFSPNQELAIRTSAVLNKTYSQAKADAELMGVKAPRPVSVSDQVQSYDKMNYDNEKATGPSVRMHYDRVLEGLSTEGDGGVTAMEQFRNFAQHMANKLNAVNASFAGRVAGKIEGGENPAVRFDVFSPSLQGGEWKPNAGSITIGRFNAGGIALGQQVGVDAQYVIDTYNDLLAQNPQMGLEPVEKVRLDAALRMPPKQVREAASAQQTAERKAKNTPEQKQQKQPDAKADVKPVEKPAAPVVEPDIKPAVVENLQDASLPTLVALLKEVQELKDEVKFERVAAELRVRKLEAEAAKATPQTEAVEEVAEPEAKPEVIATEEAAPEEDTQPLTMDEVFPNLITDTNGQNLWREGYSLSKENRTKLLGTDALSTKDIRDAIVDGKKYAEVTGQDSSRISSASSAGYVAIFDAVVSKIVPEMSKRLLTSPLYAKFQKGANPTNQIATGDLRLLNIMQRAPDGSLQFDPLLLKAGAFALADWIAQNSVTKPPLNEEKIAEKLGMKDIVPSTKTIEGYNNGTVSSDAMLQMMDRLTRFLGVKPNKDTPNGLSEGILISFANELLKSARLSGVLTGTSTQDGGVERFFYAVNKEALGFATLEKPNGLTLQGKVGIINEVITNDMRAKGYDFTPSGHQSQFQMGSDYAQTSAEQRALQVKTNAVPNFVNIPMVTVLATIAQGGVLGLFGFGAVMPDGLNINTRTSRESKNKGLVAAFETMIGQVQEMTERAEKEGVTVDKVALFREYEISSVQRLQQLGLHGDQASKLVREAITPYGGVQDLSDPTSQATQMWRRALAQAFGVKVEKLHPDSIERNLDKKLFTDEINDASEMLNEVISGNKVDQVELIAVLKEAGIDSPAKLHALIDYTRHSNATPEEQAAFYSHAYVEADGITDGPTNSVMYMWLGPITTDFVQTLANGGVSFSEKPKAAWEYFNANGDDVVLPDTYQQAGVKTAELVKAAIQKVISLAKPAGVQAVTAYSNAVITLLDTLMDKDNFTFVPDVEGGSAGNFTFKIGRGVLKNPTTVTVYGSSANGVANKVTAELFKEIYSQVSKATEAAISENGNKDAWRDFMFAGDAEVSQNFWNSLSILMSKELVSFSDKNTPLYFYVRDSKAPGGILNRNDPIKFTFDNAAFKAVSSSLRTLYVDPMVAAINSQMSGSIEGAKVVQKASNLMSAVALTMFQSIVGKELLKKTSRSQGLSPNELSKIMDKVAFLLPYLQGDEINVFVKGLGRSEMTAYDRETDKDIEFSVGANLTEKTVVRLPINSPALAGVAGSAYLNIAYGDGRMIIKASPGIIGGHLNVFDGINLALKDALANGKTINRAVIESYLNGTPFADLQKSFDKLGELDWMKLSDGEMRKISTEISPPGISLSPIEMFWEVGEQLKAAVDGERALKYVLRNVVHLSSDHMAALGAPASTEGSDRIDLSNLSIADQAVELERLVSEQKQVFAEQESKKKKPNSNLESMFDAFLNKKTNLRVFTTNQLRNVLKDLNIPEEHKQIIRSSVINLAGKEWKIALGSQEDINTYARKNGVAHQFTQYEYGLSDPNTKTILIVSNSSETLAHELVHAATQSLINAYYRDPTTLSSIDRDAISRLEVLMNDWLNNVEDFSSFRDPSTRAAVSAAMNSKSGVDYLMKQNDPAGALNEFIAWNMTNQQLLNLNSQIKVESKLKKLTAEVMALIGRLLRLPGKDLTSNIQFNVAILMRKDAPSIKTEINQSILRHVGNAPNHLVEIATQFAKMVASADVPLTGLQGPKYSDFALDVGHKLSMEAAKVFDMTAEERHAFMMVVAAYRANQVRDAGKNVQLDAYYSEIIEQMNQSIFMDDPASQDPGEQNKASARMQLLNGSIDLGKDAQGRTLLLPMVVALGATSAQAQKMFNRIKVQNRKAAAPGTTVDTFLQGLFSKAINGVMDHTYGLKPDQKVGDEIRKVVLALAAKAEGERDLLNDTLEIPEKFIRDVNNKAADLVSDVLTVFSKGIGAGIDRLQGTPAEAAANGFGKLAQVSVDLMNKRLNANATAKFTSMVNESDTPRIIKSLYGELMGINEGNQDILTLLKAGRAVIDKLRQAYRKAMPQQIADKFSRPLSQAEWAAQHMMGRADLAVLLDQGLDVGRILDLMIDSKKASALLASKEADIKRLFGKDAALIIEEAQNLANRMITGKPAHGLVKRNALAIANRAGDAVVGNLDWTSDEVQAVDGYASVAALLAMPLIERSILTTLAKTEAAGLQNTLSLIAKARSHEMERVPASLKFNIDKGYMPYERKGSFKAVSPDRLNDYTSTGYKIVGSRRPSASEELYSPDRGVLYVSTDLTPAIFRQGIMRTVRSTVFGLDMITGASFEQPSAGLITDPKIVARLSVSLRTKKQADASLAPLFNELGKIYAYERLVDQAEVKNALETQENAAVAIGQWMGRQHEEHHSEILNRTVLERLASMYEDALKTGEDSEFVDLELKAETDPVIADAMRLINDAGMKDAFIKTGGKFMVRDDLYENVIGMRSISVGDFWTGNTNVPEHHRIAIADFMTGILGKDTYRRLVSSEKAWQSLMGDARTAIVVKSVLVPGLNAAANFFQLMANGIGPVQIARKSAEFLRETHLYTQNEVELQRLSIDLAAAEGEKRPDKVRIIETKMRKIEDINRRLAVWPLIEAGEFGQITEGLDENDLEMTNGGMWDYVSKLADKLPPAVKTAGRYAIVAKDTALFAGLARTVAYTDFVAKSVLYDHLINKEKLSKKDALLRITNEFVNYDLLSGRELAYAESMGLIWFPKFKIRGIKVAASLMRNNPLHTFLSSLVPGSYEAGTVMDDNGLKLFFDGRLDNAFGIGNALRALDLNIFNQLRG